jgi:hypothetical protein
VCPPERISNWLKGELESATEKANAREGQVIGFILKNADVLVEDEKLGHVIAPRPHLFVAVEYPAPSSQDSPVRRPIIVECERALAAELQPWA